MGGEMTAEQAGRNDSPIQIKWTAGLRDTIRRTLEIFHDLDNSRSSMYRPFIKQYVYFEPRYIERVFRIPAMFPTPETPNQVIGVTGKGATAPFSTLITDMTPDLELVSKAQWFSRWRYEAHDPDSPDAWAQAESAEVEVVPGYRRVDNLTDWCLQQFRAHYGDPGISKDDIWHYLYGLLHAPDYRAQYKADLAKDLPRIPFALDFTAFQDAGVTLAALHLGYETGPLFPLDVKVKVIRPDTYQLGRRPIRWGGTRQEPDRSILHVTSHVTLRGIPDEAHKYVVNGRTPLEWAMDRLRIRQDRESGIVNDPNAWFAEDPASLVSHLQRLVYLSVETQRIVEGLPPAL